MTKLLRAGLVALLGFAVATPAALASKVVATPEKGHMTVSDDAGVFDKDSVIKAEAKFNGVTFKSSTHLTVRAFDKLPSERKGDFAKLKTKEEKRRYVTDWATTLSQAEGDKGVVVLVCNEVKLIAVVADRETKEYRNFGDADAEKVREALASGFGEAEKGTKTDDEKRAARGDGLTKATDEVISQLRNTSAPEATGGTHSSGGHDAATKSGGMHWIWWVVIVIGGLLVVWIVIALIRAMTGNVYGGGYGNGGGGGGGGGGPGFFGCFMGGMFGAMAGMWMYNSMMGTHYSHDPGASAGDTGAADGGAGETDTGAGDYDNGAEAGGDWGDGGGANAGDGGGGGGDWGNDAGGGGDWGGDAGGGGDFGGGGGDW